MKSILQSTRLVTIFLILSTGFANSQTLNVYNVNTTAFPRVTANYVAFDATGVPMEDLDKIDFQVTETAQGGNPVNVTPTLTHNCITRNEDPQATIIIILDRSTSMRELVNGKARFEYAKDAIRAFIARIKFVGETRVALVTFAGNYEVKVDWTNDPKIINDTLALMQPLTVTNYNLPFDNPNSNIFELFKQRPVNLPKFAFFLTDGHPNPPVASEPQFISTNTAKLQAQGIRFFSVTILEKTTHITLEALAKATGGKAIVTTEANLVDLFGLLALEIQVRKECSITWTSPYTCSDQGRNRTATITLQRPPKPFANVTFVAPPNSIAKTLVSDPVLFVGDPLPNQSSFANVTITAQNAPLNVTTGTVAPATYFRVTDWDFPNNQPAFAPFTLAAGRTRTLRVQFTQGPVQAFRQAQIELQGLPCPPTISLVGGQGLVLLTSPNGGELFSTCDTILIKWAGVLPTQPVTLQYSDDNEATWKIIAPAATGLSYKWLAPAVGTLYKIRVSVAPVGQYQWLGQIGGTGNETATSIALSSSGLKVFVSGYFDGPTKIGTTTSSNLPGNIDGFLAEYDSDGKFVKVHLLTGSGGGDDRVIGAVTDNLGNIYVAGYYSSPTAQFGTQSPLTKPSLDVRNMFVYKFDANFSLQWENLGKGDGASACTADATAIGIRYIGGIPQLIVAGTFQRFIRVGQNTTGGWEQSQRYNNNTNRNYYAVYDANGYAVLYANAGVPPGFTMSSLRATDANGFQYETGTFSTPTKKVTPPDLTVVNAGGSDVFISKYGSIPSSDDKSDAVFVVKAPQLSFAVPSVILDPVAQGQSGSKSFTQILCNTGDFPVVISRITFGGTNPTDFRLIGKLDGIRLDKGECVSIELEFRPSGIGPRSASLLVEGACGSNSTLQIEGEGLAPCTYDVVADVTFGKVPLGQSPVQTGICIIKNTGPEDLSGVLTVTPATDFLVDLAGPFTLKPGACLTVNVTLIANTAGVKNATIDFGLLAECGKPLSALSAEVVEPKVTISNVDFGRKRLRTAWSDEIVIANQNTEPAVISAISLTDAMNQNLKFILPGAPINLAPQQEIKIPVAFDPYTRGLHSVSVNATVQGQSQPITGEAKGTGYLPVIAATGYAFSPWTVNVTSPEKGNVTIRNTDDDAILNITSINFAAVSADFAWEYALPAMPLQIQPNESVTYTVLFTPQAAGARSLGVVICHDAKNGPDPLPPCKDTTVMLTGLGADPSDLPPLVFGNVLTCGSKTLDVVIINPNPSVPLACDAPIAAGDIAVFQISEITPFVVPAGGTYTLKVTFTPTNTNAYNVVYTIPNNQSLKLNIAASGSGITTNVDFSYGNIVKSIVGQPVILPVIVSAGNLTGITIPNVVMTFTFNEKYLAFKELVNPEAPGWSFARDVSTMGILILTATPIGATELSSGAFVSPVFDVFLTADTAVPIVMTTSIPLSCVVTTGDNGSVSVEQVCFAQGRIIQIGGSEFAMNPPTPNPASSTTTVQYSTGIKLATEFELVDRIGSLVYSFKTSEQASGTYELRIDTDMLGSGQYFLRMRSGPYATTQLLSVVK